MDVPGSPWSCPRARQHHVQTVGRLQRQQTGKEACQSQPPTEYPEVGWSLPTLSHNVTVMLSKKASDCLLLDKAAAQRAPWEQRCGIRPAPHRQAGKPLRGKQSPPLREAFLLLPWNIDILPACMGQVCHDPG